MNKKKQEQIKEKITDYESAWKRLYGYFQNHYDFMKIINKNAKKPEILTVLERLEKEETKEVFIQ